MPIAVIPARFIKITAEMARDKVKLRSLAAERKRGTKSSWPSLISRIPIDPIPGNIPNQLERRTNRKIVAIIGKYFSACSRVPKTLSVSPKIFSNANSRIFWANVGIIAIFLYTQKERKHKKSTTIQPISKVLVMGNPKMSKIFSAAIPICSIICLIIKEKLGQYKILTAVEVFDKNFFLW